VYPLATWVGDPPPKKGHDQDAADGHVLQKGAERKKKKKGGKPQVLGKRWSRVASLDVQTSAWRGRRPKLGGGGED